MVIPRTTNLDELPAFLTVGEFSTWSTIPRSTAYGLIRKKTIASVKLGRKILIPRAAIIARLTPGKAA